ncbi:hypothetical protein [Mycobacterium mantenii]|uniref:Uncharacterized protein n=1 Tax=Mycobacterium mantenii TaxID=560555 RepID=A0A1A2T2Y6_MYCNT|nr:hypothetical protein [Mycobacterium mantenii]OBH43372.1 hypothetical protein A5688_12645 [Mycobacterium mantenii]OBH48909.1 hypothetical protein A5687_14935 [Mycobacterium mantenii]OBH70397.1 hypothetical protein A5683_00290 [Mycobacterium mantenii]
MKNPTIRSEDYAAVIADSFEVLVDDSKQRGPVIGLKIDPVDAEPFIIPMTFKAAKDVAMQIAKVLMFTAPELFGA